MHPYATDSHERTNVIMGLAILSVALAWLLNRLLEMLQIVPSWWINAPSALGFFGLLYKLFDKHLWSWSLLRKIGIVRVPDLSGQWEVEGKTSFDKSSFTGYALIKQTWTTISIIFETDLSISKSLTASLLVEQPEGVTLSYEYRNDPKPNASPTMHSHRGTTVLRLKDASIMEGEYYTGRDRQNYGSLELRRIQGAC